VSNDLIATNDQKKPKQLPEDPVNRVLASYGELVKSLSAARLPEFPDPGVTMAQMKVLMLLSGGEARMSDLAHQLGISLSTLSSLVERLVEAGLARRRADTRDRRTVLVSLTEDGAELLDTFQELGIHHLRELLTQLDDEGLQAVNQAIDLLVAAARRLSAEEPR
jgi:DNA-binding MarR family transcriptional regulator